MNRHERRKTQQRAKEGPIYQYSIIFLSDEGREAVERLRKKIEEWREQWRLVNARTKGEYF